MTIIEKLINTSDSDLEDFIKNNYQEIYEQFYNTSKKELLPYKKEIKKFIKIKKQQILKLNFDNKINFDFVVLLLYTFEKVDLFLEFTLLYNYLSKLNYSLENRLKAINYYCSNIKKFSDYYFVLEKILILLESDYKNNIENKKELNLTLVNFYLHIINNFKNHPKINDLKNKILFNLNNFDFVDSDVIYKIFDLNFKKNLYDEILNIVDIYFYKQKICEREIKHIQEENSSYAQKLKSIQNIKFADIVEINRQILLEEIGNTDELHYKLKQGVKIIDEEELLYKYIFNYYKMHKLKLYDAFKLIQNDIKEKTVNIIDWGCGQALASCLLLEFIKENNLNTKIDEFLLIEPSQLALQRGILHLNLLNNYKSKIKAINKDLDCLEKNELILSNDNITFHLFSNILDVTTFQLDINFLKKISDSQTGLNYFICVSPNINTLRNMRLDIFMKYFQDNFDTKIISERENDIYNYKRYEKIFKVNFKNNDVFF